MLVLLTLCRTGMPLLPPISSAGRVKEEKTGMEVLEEASEALGSGADIRKGYR